MKRNFKCPRCKTMQSVGKRLHASWTCPKCHTSQVLTKKIVSLGYMPYRFNFLMTGRTPRQSFTKNSEN